MRLGLLVLVLSVALSPSVSQALSSSVPVTYHQNAVGRSVPHPLNHPAFSELRPQQLEGEEAGDEGGSKDEGSAGVWNPGDAWKRLEEYMDHHPDFMANALAFVIIGQVIFWASVLLLLYSELKMVWVVRNQDSRRQMAELGTMKPTEKTLEIAEKEAKSVAPRPYLTMGAMVLLMLSAFITLIPFCDVLTILGLHSGVNCWVIIILDGFIFGICFSLFVIGLIWSCTRPWAALVLIFISLLGDILCPSGNLIFMLLWGVISAVLYGWYFHWLPSSCADKGEAVPPWCQSIGSLEVSFEEKDLEAATGGVQGDFIDAANLFATLPKQIFSPPKVVGKAVKPEVGLRVRMSPTMQERGVGTITVVHPSGKHCTVSWDLGTTDSMLFTDGEAEYLVVVEDEQVATV